MPSLRTISLSLLALLLLAGGAFALVGGEAKRELLGQEEACPPGYVSGEAKEREERRERLANGGKAERGGEKKIEGCQSRKQPEKIGDLLAMQGQSGRNARGGREGVRSGAYANAVRQRAGLAAA